MSSFSGLSTALSALQATRKALDVTGNNIANVATPGYTRQRVDLQPATTAVGLMTTGQQGGNGVMLTGVSRLASAFWDAQVRSQTSLHADLASRADTLNTLQDLTGEPSDTALAGSLSKMWSAFANLASNATGTNKDAARSVVVSSAENVANSLKNGYAGIVAMWNDQRTQATSIANEVNATAQAVATFNQQIKTAVAAGNSANELMDQRDQLVVRLAELTGATTVQAPNGVVDVYLGSNALVQGGSSYTVAMSAPTTTNTLPPTGSPSLKFTDGSVASVRGGQLAGVLDALRVGGTLDTAAAQYDTVANTVKSVVNTAYAATQVAADGATVPVFFSTSGTGATGLSVAVTTSTLRTGNTDTKGAGDASVALAMSTLGKATGSPDSLWTTYVSQLGADAAGATSRTTATAATLANSVSSKQSETGVSLDEETANLLTLQRAYQAAARVLTSVDEALDTLINKTGLVGR
ncbi:flagellar hook-associated protein 1 FlgK [Quadrisphaera granulorum]|uniref:Flagellar hook-associated protein 1 n=1 Tax=Quadrisphaera granulorum TaxID=317664 RepID=A0A316AD13_9ACTN|nr:flagellar hook-associated protein FlgK [Quadrisphaera granulorum]PWJ55645.1 flagellar hook-associated protein 1 FlgK [Quadrisphaera granulorum]SZE95142.1 flagellar hook-associated protein 1 FlgK [Quadrisphaera granulorum]